MQSVLSCTGHLCVAENGPTHGGGVPGEKQWVRNSGALPAMLPLQHTSAAAWEAQSPPQGLSSTLADSTRLERESNHEASGQAQISRFWYNFSLAGFAWVSPPCC